MNIFDIIIIICLAVSAIFGFRDGAIKQLGGLAGIIAAIILAKVFGSSAKELFNIQGDYADIWGYIIVLVVSLILATVIVNIVSRFISAVGLGILDRIGGAAVSIIKCMLIISILLSMFNFVNGAFKLVDTKSLKQSILYEPVLSTSKYIMPAITWVGEQIPYEQIEKLGSGE